jgi:hypothetical protein
MVYNTINNIVSNNIDFIENKNEFKTKGPFPQ